jgi:ABC-type glutathione transport system ATPase component
MSAPPVLEVRDLTVRHLRRGRLFARATYLEALQGVSFEQAQGEALAIAVESGSGKSTLVRSLFRCTVPPAGRCCSTAWIWPSCRRPSCERRRGVQLVFRDPLASLDPTKTVGQVVSEPLLALRVSPDPGRSVSACWSSWRSCGLAADLLERRSQRLSGGQAQRVAIARALVTDPEVLICDEPVSALDASLRSQILDLLAQLRRQRGLSLLFITHDLGAARYLCERTLVLHRGKVVEQGATVDVLQRPQHEFTRQLLAATLTVDPVAARQQRAARHAATQ